MNVSLLAISIGNTRTQFGTYVNGKITERLLVNNSDTEALGITIEMAFAALKEDPDAPVVLASVNPAVTRLVTEGVKRRLGRQVLRIEEDLKVPIGRQLDRETIVGEDRLLNAAATYDVLKQACVIVDAGTAITVDYVDGAGTFHGGAIGPGARMMLRSLHQGAAQLPEVEFQRPEEAVGHNTAEAMRSAIFYGLRGMVRELSEQYALTAGSYPLVIATGGDAEVLFGDYELIERVVPDLTLRGIAVTYQTYVNTGGDVDAEDDPSES